MVEVLVAEVFVEVDLVGEGEDLAEVIVVVVHVEGPRLEELEPEGL